MLDSYFYELLHSGKPLLTIRDNMLLTEFSYASRRMIPVNCHSHHTAGYTPILAHPERYPYCYGNLKMIQPPTMRIWVSYYR
ncbi:MAG: CpsB/CapC family capsule biosynthesis tyrosine phosphatase [Ferruginibacter sp.]